MDKRALLDQYSATPEERIMLSQVLDHMTAAQRKSIPSCTAFLSPHERICAERLLASLGGAQFLSLGGYPDAERRVLLFLPDWMDAAAVDAAEYLALLRCSWYEGDSLTHRDFLGALMGMGVRRDTIGDILVGQSSCDLVLLPGVAAFLRDSLLSAGRVHLKVERIALSDISVPAQARRVIHDTVATLRLDSVLAVAFSTSRSKAAQLIASGRCAVNWQETDRTSLLLKEGDVISCRGLGKCRLAQVGALSRKGRINVTVERYL